MKGRENSKKSMPFNVFFFFHKGWTSTENISQSDTMWTPTDYSSSALIKESQELATPAYSHWLRRAENGHVSKLKVEDFNSVEH